MPGNIQTLVRPTNNGSTIQWYNSGSFSSNYQHINNVVTQPTISGTDSYVYADQDLDDDYDDITMGTSMSIPTYSNNVDQVTLWVLAADVEDEVMQMRLNIKIGGNWISERTVNLTDTSFIWYSETWTGNWRRSDFEDFQARYRAELSMSGSEEIQIAVVYAIIYSYPMNIQMV